MKIKRNDVEGWLFMAKTLTDTKSKDNKQFFLPYQLVYYLIMTLRVAKNRVHIATVLLHDNDFKGGEVSRSHGSLPRQTLFFFCLPVMLVFNMEPKFFFVDVIKHAF